MCIRDRVISHIIFLTTPLYRAVSYWYSFWLFQIKLSLKSRSHIPFRTRTGWTGTKSHTYTRVLSVFYLVFLFLLFCLLFFTFKKYLLSILVAYLRNKLLYYITGDDNGVFLNVMPPITSRTVVRQCCKDNNKSQWGVAKFDTPSTDRHKN